MKFANIDTSMLPILVSSSNELDEPTIADIDEYFDELEKLFSTIEGPIVFVTTNTRATKMNSLDGKMHLAKRSQQLTEKYPGKSKASIIVADGLVATMALKMFSAFYKPLKDSIIVSSTEAAIAKAKEIVAKELVAAK